MDLKRKILVLVLMVFALTWAGNSLACQYGDCEGCTPGYWKQEQHFDSWPDGISPDDTFYDVFGVDYFGEEMTLLQALKKRGGKCNALARHAVAALLNARTGDPSLDVINYVVTRDWLIGWVQECFSLGYCEQAKDFLEYLNEQGCPLN